MVRKSPDLRRALRKYRNLRTIWRAYHGPWKQQSSGCPGALEDIHSIMH